MLEDRYKAKIFDYYDNYRNDVVPLLPKHTARVLEIGCGTGNTLAYLKANGYCDWTCGVEMFPDAVEEAATKVDLVHLCNIEDALLPIEAGSIDLILCLDVLEHCVNPQKIIAYLHTLLTPEGTIIASIPNVRHYSVVFPLVFKNRWDYEEVGILDHTHLRFFVKNTAISLMESSGLKLDSCIISNFYASRMNKILIMISFGIISSFLTKNYLVKVTSK